MQLKQLLAHMSFNMRPLMHKQPGTVKIAIVWHRTQLMTNTHGAHMNQRLVKPQLNSVACYNQILAINK